MNVLNGTEMRERLQQHLVRIDNEVKIEEPQSPEMGTIIPAGNAEPEQS